MSKFCKQKIFQFQPMSLHNAHEQLIEQLIDLRKVRSENLKFRTDLRDLVMEGWPVTQ